MIKPYLLCCAAMLLGFTAASAPGQAPQEALPAQTPVAAPVPAPAATFKNPVKPTAESQAKAKSLYAIDCAMCHDDNGNGQTDLVKSMELKLGDWSEPAGLPTSRTMSCSRSSATARARCPPSRGTCQRQRGLEHGSLHPRILKDPGGQVIIAPPRVFSAV